MWRNYETATNLSEKSTEIRTATLLSCIGIEGFELCKCLDFAEEEDRQKIDKVLDRLERHSVGEVNETFERFKFNQRNQEASELIDAYVSAIRVLVKSCNFAALEESLLRDGIVMGIRDDATRKKLLQTRQLDLKLTIDICRANESSSQHFREMRVTDDVQKLHLSRKPQPVDVGNRDVPSYRRLKQQQRASQPTAKCKFCGQESKFQNELCPAFGRTCKKCKKKRFSLPICADRDPRTCGSRIWKQQRWRNPRSWITARSGIPKENLC